MDFNEGYWDYHWRREWASRGADAYASVNSSSLYKTNLKLTHLKKTKHIQSTHRPILNLSIVKIVLLPLLSVILVTIGG